MRISTRLRISLIATVAALAVLLPLLGWSFIEFRSAKSDYFLVDQLEDAFYERAAIRDQYFLHKEERILIQWSKANDSISNLIRSAGLQFRSEKYQLILQQLRGDLEEIQIIFQRIARNQILLDGDSKTRSVYEELDKRLFSQLLLKSANDHDIVSALHDDAAKRVEKTYQTLSIGIGLFAFMLALATILTSISMGRLIRLRLLPLHEGAKIVAAGNLDYRIEQKGQDEFSELALSINGMTDNLQIFTQQLQAEIEAHQESEDALAVALSRLQSITSRVPGMIVCQLRLRADGSFCIPYASAGMLDICRIHPDAVKEDAAPLFALLHPDDLPKCITTLQASAIDLSPWFFEFRLRFKDSAEVWLIANFVPQCEPDDSILWCGFIIDITERKKVESALAISEEQFRTMFELASVGIVQVDVRTGELLHFNEKFREITGYSTQELYTLQRQDLTHPDDLEHDWALFFSAVRGDTPDYRNEKRYIRKDGSTVWVRMNASFIRDVDGRALRSVAICEDITASRHAQEALRISATAFESQEGILVTDADGIIQRVNNAFTEITGFTANEAVGHNPRILKSGKHEHEFYADMWAKIKLNGIWQGEIWNRRKNGELYLEWETISEVRDDAGVLTHYVANFIDISERKAAENQIRNLAFYDPLTGLPNRRLLMDRLNLALVAGARHKRQGALLFIDLDDFKTLNETLGHAQGDLLLQQVASRLAVCTRESDTVARLGGDEFVVMLEDLSENAVEAATQAESVAEKILNALNASYQLENQEIRSTPSIGITLFGDQQEGVDEMLKRADMAMYQAKSAGRNTMRFFDPEMQAAVTARAGLESDLRNAIAANQFVLYYQAQVVGVGRLTGVEALVRWQHPLRGMVSPAEFIPLAEDTALILPLGLWVLESACRQLAAWALQPELEKLTMAVNVSPLQFRQKDFVDQVLAVLDHSAANPHRLKLELTEGMLVSNIEDIILKMNALKERGVQFSLDDFGTGYSSLSYLKLLPLDQLKIDQGFVRDILVDPNDAAIAKMIISLAQSLGLGVIAEGVENHQQWQFLAEHGCIACQGYLFSRPLPLSEFEAFAKRKALDERGVESLN